MPPKSVKASQKSNKGPQRYWRFVSEQKHLNTGISKDELSVLWAEKRGQDEDDEDAGRSCGAQLSSSLTRSRTAVSLVNVVDPSSNGDAHSIKRRRTESNLSIAAETESIRTIATALRRSSRLVAIHDSTTQSATQAATKRQKTELIESQSSPAFHANESDDIPDPIDSSQPFSFPATGKNSFLASITYHQAHPSVPMTAEATEAGTMERALVELADTLPTTDWGVVSDKLEHFLQVLDDAQANLSK